MPKRSKQYSPSKHGTGWPSGHPTDAEIRFLNSATVNNNDKVKFIVNNNATPPKSLATSLPAPPPPPGTPTTTTTGKVTTTKQEVSAGIGGIVTSHYIINYSKTGFPVRLFHLNYPKVNITIA